MSKYILGINWAEERSACLLADGVLLHAVQEERLDRVRHSPGHPIGIRPGQPRALPYRSIFECLEARSLTFDDLELIVVHSAYRPVDLGEMRRQLPIREKQRIVTLPEPSHHLGHAAAVYFTSGLADSAVLIVDCFGSSFKDVLDPGTDKCLARMESETIFRGRGSSIERIWRQTRARCSSSMGLAYLYRLVSLICRFLDENTAKQQSALKFALHEPALTMGLAGYGRNRADWPPLLRFRNDGIDYSGVWSWLSQLNLVRTARPGGVTLRTGPLVRGEQEPLTSLHADLARRAQDESERALVHLARVALEATGSRNLCLGGEMALNGGAIERVRREVEIDRLWVHPGLGGDEGNAIGAALYGWHVVLSNPTPRALTEVHLGRSYGPTAIDTALAENGLPSVVCPEDRLMEEVATRLSNGQLIGWFEGAAEFGGRALGHRSIFGDPRRRGVRTRINSAKGRPSFCPVATAVTLEQATRYFELEGASPYKLRVVRVREDARDRIPGAVHVDGTACVQTVTSGVNPSLYALLRAFDRLTDVPVLLHTSLRHYNLPLVETPAAALQLIFSEDIRLDALVIERRIVPRELLSNEELLRKIPNLNRDCWLVHDGDAYWWCRVNGDPVPLANPVVVAILSAVDGNRDVRELVSEVAGPTLHQEEMSLALGAIRTLLRSRAILIKPGSP